jgi:2-keto-4-pentenoate hydratase/2-oxohepta-3-ene-1,7-dioic acid hydratase in catechol pathway
MKLCRFDLESSPGTPRTGIVLGGKVYETEGANPVGVHDWTEARLLSPVGHPPSVRLFPALSNRSDAESYEFFYLNPNAIAGPNAVISVTEGTELSCIPCLGIVVAGGGASVPVAEADGVVLGLTLANVFFQGSDKPLSELPAWAFDAGIAVGPAITTPDELEESVADESKGRLYDFPVTLGLNGEEILATNLAAMGATPAELLSFASLTCPLRQGDLLLAAIAAPPPNVKLRSGDQARLASESLGTLSTRLT